MEVERTITSAYKIDDATRINSIFKCPLARVLNNMTYMFETNFEIVIIICFIFKLTPNMPLITQINLIFHFILLNAIFHIIKIDLE